MASMRLNRKRHVIDRAEVEKKRCDLKRPRQSKHAAVMHRQPRDVAACEPYRTGVRASLTGDLIDQRRLPRAVWSDYGVKFTSTDLERKPVGSHDAREVLGQGRDLEQWLTRGAWSPAFYPRTYLKPNRKRVMTTMIATC